MYLQTNAKEHFKSLKKFYIHKITQVFLSGICRKGQIQDKILKKRYQEKRENVYLIIQGPKVGPGPQLIFAYFI